MIHLPEPRREGFTLMELIIVMAILSILAVIITNTFSISLKRGRDSRRKDDLHSLAAALEAYYSDHTDSSGRNVYPIGISGVMHDYNNQSTTYGWGGAFKDANGTLYMVQIPQDPLQTQKYYYVSNGLSYAVYAKLENPFDEGDGVNQSGYTNATGTNCGNNGNVLCTYGISSSNTTPAAMAP